MDLSNFSKAEIRQKGAQSFKMGFNKKLHKVLKTKVTSMKTKRFVSFALMNYK